MLGRRRNQAVRHSTVDLARQMVMAGWKSAGDQSSERSISSICRASEQMVSGSFGGSERVANDHASAAGEAEERKDEEDEQARGCGRRSLERKWHITGKKNWGAARCGARPLIGPPGRGWCGPGTTPYCAYRTVFLPDLPELSGSRRGFLSPRSTPYISSASTPPCMDDRLGGLARKQKLEYCMVGS